MLLGAVGSPVVLVFAVTLLLLFVLLSITACVTLVCRVRVTVVDVGVVVVLCLPPCVVWVLFSTVRMLL